MIKKMIVKYSTRIEKEISRELEYEIQQLISKSISAKEPVDIFSLLKKEKPDISILDEDFLNQFKSLPQKNYAVDLLLKLLRDDIRLRMKKNQFRYSSLQEKLQQLIERYNYKLISTTEAMNELIEVARQLKRKVDEGKELNLSEEELAFYDALLNEKKFFEREEQIIEIARILVNRLGNFVKIVDWNKKNTLRAKIKVEIREILANRLAEKADYNDVTRLTEEIFETVESVYAA